MLSHFARSRQLYISVFHERQNQSNTCHIPVPAHRDARKAFLCYLRSILKMPQSGRYCREAYKALRPENTHPAPEVYKTEYHFHTCCGVYQIEDPNISITLMKDKARVAMERAKNSPFNHNYVWFSESMWETIVGRTAPPSSCPRSSGTAKSSRIRIGPASSRARASARAIRAPICSSSRAGTRTRASAARASIPARISCSPTAAGTPSTWTAARARSCGTTANTSRSRPP